MTSESVGLLRDLEKRLEGHGLTPEGTRWILKALHPASSLGNEAIPDSTYYKTVRAEYRSQSVVTAPTGTTGTWDLYVMRFPFENVPVYCCAFPSASGPPTSSVTTTLLGPLNPSENVVSASGTYTQSVGTYWAVLPEAGTIDTGVATTGQLSFMQNAAGVESFRNSYASLTCYMTASTLYDQGTVYAAQNAPDYIDGNPKQIDGGDIFTHPAVGVTRAFTSSPYDETDMATKNPRYYVAQAREGCYMPLRLAGPMQPFSRYTMTKTLTGSTQSVTQGKSTVAGVMGALDQIAVKTDSSYVASTLPCLIIPQLMDTLDLTQTGFATFPDGFYYGIANGNTLANLFTDNTNVGVVIFRGLNPNASITVKYIAGMEFDVDTDSSFRQFAQIPPKYDPRALEAYYRIVHEMKDVYPSSWNSLGTIAAAVSNVVQTLWPIAKPYLASMLKKGLSLVAPDDMSAQQKTIVAPSTNALPQKGKQAKKAARAMRKQQAQGKAK